VAIGFACILSGAARTSCKPVVGLSLVSWGWLITTITLPWWAIAALAGLIALLGLLLVGLSRIRGLVLGSLISLVSLIWLIHRISPTFAGRALRSLSRCRQL